MTKRNLSNMLEARTHEDYDTAYERFACGWNKVCETKEMNISTMTLTAVLRSSWSSESLTDRLRAVSETPTTRCDVTDPSFSCKKSTFCAGSYDIRPFPSGFPGILVRVYATGHVLIMGCKTPAHVVTALHDVCVVLDCSHDFPVVRLINAHSVAKRKSVRLDTIRQRLSTINEVARVDRPERQNRLLIRMHSGVKASVFSSGRYSLHGNDWTDVASASHLIKKFLY